MDNKKELKILRNYLISFNGKRILPEFGSGGIDFIIICEKCYTLVLFNNCRKCNADYEEGYCDPDDHKCKKCSKHYCYKCLKTDTCCVSCFRNQE